MPEPIDDRDFAGPHPTYREFVAQLAAWGFTERGEDRVHTIFRGPRGGTLRVLRSRLGRADPALTEKAARVAGVTPARFWAGPEPAQVPQQVPRPGSASRAAARDSVISIVLSIHAQADRPLGFDQVVQLSANRVTRAQAAGASASLCRAGHLDRIRAGVYQWSAGQRTARLEPAARQPGSMSVPAAEGPTAAEVFHRLFPAGVQMTADMLSDLEQWARLTGRLAQGGTAQAS